MSSSLGYLPPVFAGTQLEDQLSSTINIVEQPAELLAAGNKNCLSLATITSAGPFLKAALTFTVNGNIFEGNNFTLTSDKLGTLILTAKDEPQVLEFKTTAAALTAQSVAEDIAAALNDIILFNRYYVAEAFTGGGVINIVAKTTGSAFSLSFGSVGSFIVNSNQAGTDESLGQISKDYSAYIQIFAGNNFSYSFGEPAAKDNFCLISEAEKKFSPANLFEFDIAGALNDEFNIVPPNFGTNTPVYSPLLPYFVLWGEGRKQGTQIRRKELVGTTAVKWASPAALQYENYDSSEGLEAYVVTEGKIDACFSTNQIKKHISLDAKELLTIIIKAQAADLFRIVVVTITPTFIDGAIGMEQIAFGAPTASAGAYTFDVSPSQLPISAIESAAGKKIRSYDIKMRYANSISDLVPPYFGPIATKVQTYEITEPCNSLTIAFLNAFGYFDTIELIGEAFDNTRRKTTEFIKNLPCSPEKSSRIRGLKAVDLEPFVSVSSGYFEQESYNWLLEFAAAPEAFIVEEDNTLTAIVLDSVTLRQDTTNEKYFLEVDYIKSLKFNSQKI